MRAGFIVSLFCFILLPSCTGDRVIASVDNSELTESDAMIIMEHLGYNLKDKKEWELFINQWTEQEALRLELADKDELKAKLVTMRSQAYSGELSKYYLEELALAQKVDTSISEKELLSYYKKHKQEFALQDYLVKALYIKVPKGVQVEKDLREHYVLKNDKDLSKVNSYAKLYAENFYFDDEQWIYFTELVKDIPLQDYNKDNIVLNRTKTYFSDDEFTYFLNIIDYKLKDSAPPFEFLKQQIREIILSARINSLREDIGSKLIKITKSKHDIKINL
ncbi:MAG: hypothetical protein ACK457_05880 [Flavobacteriia bacterium]